MTTAKLIVAEPPGAAGVDRVIALLGGRLPDRWFSLVDRANWFGAGPALAALVLAAASDFHALYTRAALTDALLVFFFLLAIWLTERACRTGAVGLVIAAGLATGCAWWTKYNGWLPLAISFGGIALQGLVDRRARAMLPRRLVRWLLIAAIGFLVWSPFLFSLQSRGGYAAVAANHRQYLMGLEGWPGSLWRQHANLRHFDGAVSVLAWAAVGLLGGLGCATRGTPGGDASGSSNRWMPVACGGLAASVGAFVGTDVCLLLLTAVGLGSGLRRAAGPGETDLESRSAPLGYLVSWCLGLLILTPFYYPYPRLALPWLCGMWLGAGLGLATLFRSVRDWREGEVSGKTRLILAGVGLTGWITLACALPSLVEVGVPAWQARTGLQRIAACMQADLERLAAEAGRPADETIVYVYGEPALFYQLRALGLQLVAPVQGMPMRGAGSREAVGIVVLATGPHAHRSRQFARQWSDAAGNFSAFTAYEYRPSDWSSWTRMTLERLTPRGGTCASRCGCIGCVKASGRTRLRRQARDSAFRALNVRAQREVRRLRICASHNVRDGRGRVDQRRGCSERRSREREAESTSAGVAAFSVRVGAEDAGKGERADHGLVGLRESFQQPGVQRKDEGDLLAVRVGNVVIGPLDRQLGSRPCRHDAKHSQAGFRRVLGRFQNLPKLSAKARWMSA